MVNFVKSPESIYDIVSRNKINLNSIAMIIEQEIITTQHIVKTALQK